MDNKLYYTIQMILADVNELIKDPNIHIDIVNFYNTIKIMDDNNEFEYYLDYETTPDVMTQYLKEEFDSVMGLYLDNLIKEAEEYAIKKRNENII